MDLSILSWTYYSKFGAHSAINTQCNVSKSAPDPDSTAFWGASVPLGRWSHVFLRSPVSWVTLQGDLSWSVMHTSKELVRSQTVSSDVSTFRESSELKMRKMGSVRQRGWSLMCPWGPLCLCACLRGSAAVINTVTKSSLGRDRFISTYSVQSTIPESQCRDSRQEPWSRKTAESIEELCSLVCSSWLAQPAFLNIQDH